MEQEPLKWPQNLTWWHKISEKCIETAMTQSETLLKESVATGQTIQDRADKLLAILAPAIPATFIYILTDLKNINDLIHVTAMVALAAMIVSFCLLFPNIKAYQINVPGDLPEVLLNNNLIAENDIEKEQFLKIALLICENNKIRIESNDLSNEERSRRNQKAINVLIIGLVASPLIACLVTLLNASYF